MHSLLATVLLLLSRFIGGGDTPPLEATSTYDSLLSTVQAPIIDLAQGTSFSITANSSYVLTNSVIPLKLQGGTAPYTFTASAGKLAGKLLTLKIATTAIYYQAPQKEGVVSITVTDGKHITKELRLAVVNKLTLPSAIVNIQTGRSYTITPNGGKAPYKYKVISGLGTLNGNVVQTSSTQGKTRVQVRDSLDQEIYLDIIAITTSINTANATPVAVIQPTTPSLFPVAATPTVIPGFCGKAHNETFTDTPTTNLCIRGQASHVQGTGPWTWSCAGTNGGTTDFCSAAKSSTIPPVVPPTPVPDPTPAPTPIPIPTPTPVNGSCGASHNQTFSSIPTANFCTTGSVSSVYGTGPWTWSCNGSNGGTNASCQANVQVVVIPPPVPPPVPIPDPVPTGPVYYVSDCGTGSVPNCVPGNDGNTGTSTAQAWKTCDKVTAKFGSFVAGTQILFARGSAMIGCKLYFLTNFNSRANNPILFGAYTPTWATGNEGNPILNAVPGAYTLSLMNSGNSSHDEGYIVQDLHLIGSGVNNPFVALVIGNDVDYVTVRRLEIEEYSLGVQCIGGTGAALNTGSDGKSEHVKIQNSNIHHIRGIGILGSCNDLLIENNRFDNIGINMFDHSMYLSGYAIGSTHYPATQNIIRGNTVTNNDSYSSITAPAPTPGGCSGVALVIHGQQDGTLIENNTFYEPTIPIVGGGCWGISIDSGLYPYEEYFKNMTVRNNNLINYGMSIGVDLCNTCTIENNSIYSEVTDATGIVAPSKYFSTVDPKNVLNTDNNITIRNNSLYLKNSRNGTFAIRLSRDGTNHTVVSNLIYFGGGTTAQSSCFYTAGLAPSAFTTFDNNLCYYSATPGTWDNVRTTLTAQQAAGLDTHSKSSNPNLVPPTSPTYRLQLSASSPAIDAGNTLRSTLSDILSKVRDSLPDIGAYEF